MTLADAIFNKKPHCKRRKFISDRMMRENPKMKRDWCSYCVQFVHADGPCPIRELQTITPAQRLNHSP